MAVTFGDDIIVGDVVHIGECAPHPAGRVRVDSNLVACVPPWGPRVFVPPYPRFACVERPGKADVRVGNVVTVVFERIDIVVPRCSYHQTGAYPCTAGLCLPAGGGIRIAVEPRSAAIMRDIGLAPEKYQSIGVGVAYSDSERCVASLKRLSHRCGDVIGRHVVTLEPRILEISGTPVFTAVIAAIDSLMIGWMETGACVQNIHYQWIAVGRENLPVLGD